MLPLFIKGLILGFSVAAPVGPIGVFCIRRTLESGKAAGLATGLGAAVADGIYGVIAAFGLTAITSLLAGNDWALRLFGGAFLLFLGVRSMLSVPSKNGSGNKRESLWKDFGSTFLLTISNPATILSFLAMFSVLGIGAGAGDLLSATLMVTGVFLGSATWWFMLSGSVSLVRKKFSLKAMRVINIVSGIIISAFGGLALLSLLP